MLPEKSESPGSADDDGKNVKARMAQMGYLNALSQFPAADGGPGQQQAPAQMQVRSTPRAFQNRYVQSFAPAATKDLGEPGDEGYEEGYEEGYY